MTGIFIFTRDRPLQLDACLRSLKENAPQLSAPTVLARWTSDRFEEGYEILVSEHPDVEFVFETNFEQDVRAILPTLPEHTLFLCDDSITFRPLPADPVDALTDDVISFSLRIGRNTRYCHPRNLWHDQPESMEERGEFLVWEWAESPEGDVFAYHGKEGDFGYPYSLDGVVHRVSCIIEWIGGKGFENPNRMEGAVLSTMRTDVRPKLSAYHESVQVGIPVNAVNTLVLNRVGVDFPQSTDDLNDLYLAGKRIDYKAMDFTDVNGSFKEMPLLVA